LPLVRLSLLRPSLSPVPLASISIAHCAGLVCRMGFWCPATRPGLAPAGESLLSAGSERSNQEREPNVHVRRGVQRHSARCVHRRRTQTKYSSIRARAPGPGPRSTLRGRSAVRVGAGRRGLARVGRTFRMRPCAGSQTGVQPQHVAIAPDGACVAQRRRRVRPAVGSVMQSARCIPVAAPVHGWGSICSQFSGGEHTVPHAVACPGVHERSKTFLVPFGVHQKGLACRGETRPGGSAPAPQGHAAMPSGYSALRRRSCVAAPPRSRVAA
jgi:hypothetical protein